MSADNLDTKPTIETVLERINALAETFQKEISIVHTRLEEFDVRFDRLEGVILKTRMEFVEMRADLTEWRKQLRDVLPPVA